MPLVTLEERTAPSSGPRPFALWALGFRPFYLVAAVQAALSIGLWALQFAGLLPGAYLQGPAWHAHEMLFGFAVAVIVGFLFTAGHNWTGKPTPTGCRLAALVALWLAGRVLVLTPWAVAAAVANVAFPVTAAIALAVPLVQARNRRNYFFVALLLALAVAALAFHLAQLGVRQWPAWVGVQLALDVVLVVTAVMAGRVVPMFTNNGVPGAGATRRPALETLSIATVVVLLAADLARLDGVPLAVLASVGAVAHGARAALWKPWRTARVPLVWVLHAAYAWIPLHLALRAGAALGIVPSTIAVHALTVGAIGGLTIGMMTRTALGHTGRPLRAGRAEVACYGLVVVAALLRVLVPLVAPALTVQAIVTSAFAWSAAFGLYAVVYAPRLVLARADGRPG